MFGLPALVIAALIGIGFGACGALRLFLMGWVILAATLAGLLYWEYVAHIAPFFETAQSDDGRGIGFGILMGLAMMAFPLSMGGFVVAALTRAIVIWIGDRQR